MARPKRVELNSVSKQAARPRDSARREGVSRGS